MRAVRSFPVIYVIGNRELFPGRLARGDPSPPVVSSPRRTGLSWRTDGAKRLQNIQKNDQQGSGRSVSARLLAFSILATLRQKSRPRTVKNERGFSPVMKTTLKRRAQ